MGDRRSSHISSHDSSHESFQTISAQQPIPDLEDTQEVKSDEIQNETKPGTSGRAGGLSPIQMIESEDDSIIIRLPLLGSDVLETIKLPQESIETFEIEERSEVVAKTEKYYRIKKSVFEFLTEPTYSKGAMIYQFLQLGTILLSTVTFLVSSEPEQWDKPSSSLQALELFSIIIFTSDYLLRLMTCSNPASWIFELMNMIDLFAILPFYFELLLTSTGNIGGLAVLRVVRLLRVLRIIKAGKHTSEVPILVETFKRSKRGFSLLLFGLSLVLILFSSAMFYAEQTAQKFDNSMKKWIRDDGSESPYQSILSTTWWCMVTVTTVGYGDAFPISEAGKVVAAFTMFFGILSLAFPMVIFSQNFQIVQEEFQNKRRTKKTSEKMFNGTSKENGENGSEFSQNESLSEGSSSKSDPTRDKLKKLKDEQLHFFIRRELKCVDEEVEIFKQVCKRIENRVEFLSDILFELERREKVNLKSMNTSPSLNQMFGGGKKTEDERSQQPKQNDQFQGDDGKEN